MTAQPLGLDNAGVGSAVRWHWLAPAVQMAALVSGNWPLSVHRDSVSWTCFPRIATRTPGSGVGAVSAARQFTVQTLFRWGVTERNDDIAIVVTEMLTNALRHALPAGERGGQPVRLGLLEPGPCVLVAVADPSDTVPVPHRGGGLTESGRGLHVISALSDRWGYTRFGDTRHGSVPGDNRAGPLFGDGRVRALPGAGKVVWAMFSTVPVADRGVGRRVWRMVPAGRSPAGGS
jgi:anti-sigma regulatory factor (Ser/Thr protein kinase)